MQEEKCPRCGRPDSVLVSHENFGLVCEICAGVRPEPATLSADPQPALLTPEEEAVMSDICSVWQGFCSIVGNGPTREADLGEIVPLIHQLQQAVMSQACARAYPTEYRLLGETISG